MKLEVDEKTATDVRALDDRFRRATHILVTHETRQKYSTGFDAICAEPIAPVMLPSTREEATPHILLCGPFSDEPGLLAVAIWVGIGFIEIRDIDGADCCSYGFSAIDGDGVEARNAFVQAAFPLYFDDVTVMEKAES